MYVLCFTEEASVSVKPSIAKFGYNGPLGMVP